MSTRDKHFILKRNMRERGASEKDISRAILAGEIMGWKNERGDYSRGVYDCGELGILLLYFRREWESEWLELEPLPEGM